MAAFPLRYHLDRAPVLFQLRADALLCRNRTRCPKRRATETPAARALVVSMGGDGNRYLRPPLPPSMVGANRLLVHPMDGCDLHRRHAGARDVGERVVRDMAESKDRDRERSRD